jgi:hypothetical protein
VKAAATNNFANGFPADHPSGIESCLICVDPRDVNGRFVMSKVFAGALAVIALSAFAGAAHAANVCVWTGNDWACGDGNVVTQHYPASVGPNMQITPVQTQVNPATSPGPGPVNAWRPY